MSQVAERAHVGAYVDAEQRRQLIELARRDDRSVSSVIRQALRAHVERERDYRDEAALEPKEDR
jgi:predicted transcriptional regulator